MADDAVDHEARGMARGTQQLIESHERIDEERFGQLRTDIDELKQGLGMLNTKFDGIKDMIGKRPTWIVMAIITTQMGIIGFMAARLFPG